ncbi:MAG: hypothetical protein KAR42_14870 [candidate division Zixibacteria bacterium]|nr:hypothetical protein [candidate division Zixibacteria bacterium]
MKKTLLFSAIIGVVFLAGFARSENVTTETYLRSIKLSQEAYTPPDIPVEEPAIVEEPEPEVIEIQQHTYKKHIQADGSAKIGYYYKEKFQKYVSDTKPAYTKYAAENTVEEIPYIAPPPAPEISIEKLSKKAAKLAENQLKKTCFSGMVFNENKIDTSEFFKDKISGSEIDARDAKAANESFVEVWPAKDANGEDILLTLTADDVIVLAKQWRQLVRSANLAYYAKIATIKTADRAKLESYLSTGVIE